MKIEDIELDRDKLNQLHQDLLTGGLAYEYGGGRLQLTPPESKAIGSHSLGLSNSRIREIQEAHMQWLTVAYSTLSTSEGRHLVNSLLSRDDIKRIELRHFSCSRPLYSDEGGYITSTNITRIDHLYDGKGNILGCDPNLVPMGMGYTNAYVHGIGSILGDNPFLGNLGIYEERLAAAASIDKEKISGIVTSTRYPLWRMHLYMANLVREKYGLPMYVIPPEAVNSESGQVDIGIVRGLYDRLGINLPSIEAASQAGTLIRYCRELQTVGNPEVRVVNPAGIRVMESQLWNALISLPGYGSFYKRLTGREVDLDLHSKTYISSALARVNITRVEIAIGINDNGSFEWENDVRKLPKYEEMTKPQGTVPRYKGVLKTFSTSGNKGVRRFTGNEDGLVYAMHRAYVDIYHCSPPVEGAIMLVQPFVDSIQTFTPGQDLCKLTEWMFFYPVWIML